MSFAVPDPHRVAALIQKVADEEILPRYHNLASDEVREKAPGDLVSIADEQAEVALSRLLPELLPGSAVVGEEAVAKDASVLKRLAQSNVPVWVVDPVDGTANFVSGKGSFGTLVALVNNGRTEGAWLLEQITGRTGIAVRGSGCELNGSPMRLDGTLARRREGGAIAAVTVSRVAPATRTVWKEGFDGWVKLRSVGSAVSVYLDLISGKVDVLVTRQLTPWDHAAGLLAHAEAGGVNAALDGRDYNPTDYFSDIIAAPDADFWQRVASVVSEEG